MPLESEAGPIRYEVMHTQRRFCDLTKKATKKAVELQVECGDTPATVDLEPSSLARMIALAEALGMNQVLLIEELISSALGDAHDGFLSAFTDPEERERANTKLKARVKALLPGITQ